ncbi:MAG: hypothetical protein M0P49_05845 [Bacilli bacterium]|nr:hypothetical protein [Bacilli bacterium]
MSKLIIEFTIPEGEECHGCPFLYRKLEGCEYSEERTCRLYKIRVGKPLYGKLKKPCECLCQMKERIVLRNGCKILKFVKNKPK